MNTINNKNTVTIDHLAEMVQAGFLEVKESINNLDIKIEGVEKTLNNRIDGVENILNNRIDGVEYKIHNLGYRVDKFEQKVDARFDELSYRIDGLAVDKVSYDEHKKLHGRVSYIERKLAI